MSRHRAEARPRYGRLVVLASALAVTIVALLGGTGLISAPGGDPAVADAGQPGQHTQQLRTSPVPTPQADRSERLIESAPADPRTDTTLPAGSGSGKRIVFSQSRQRVWLVEGGRHVLRTYLVSGSTYDNLEPGTYAVYSRSEQAYGVDDSGTMRLFVRFTQGDSSAIGFHDIPVLDGKPLQTAAQLGTPQSHGCIRQRHVDALALWDFAPIGTAVVVTA